jgi:phage tail-like protein
MPMQNDTEPMVGLYFTLQIDQVQNARFMECSSLVIDTKYEDYHEGGSPQYTYRYPVSTTYSNVTLKYGTHVAGELFEWYLETVDGVPRRQDISIFLYDSEGNVLRTWILKDAFPVKWVGPAMRADKGDVAVDTLELAYSGIRMEPVSLKTQLRQKRLSMGYNAL